MGDVGPVVQVVHDVIHLLGKVLDVAHRSGIGQRGRGPLIAARCAADPQIDPAGIERLQHPKRLGHFERAVVRQHDPAAADPNRVGRRGDLSDHDLGTRAGETGQAVMFRHPIPAIPERFGSLGQLDRLVQRLSRGTALPNRGLIHHAQCQPRRHASPFKCLAGIVDRNASRVGRSGRDRSAYGNDGTACRSVRTRGTSSDSCPRDTPSRWPRRCAECRW